MLNVWLQVFNNTKDSSDLTMSRQDKYIVAISPSNIFQNIKQTSKALWNKYVYWNIRFWYNLHEHKQSKRNYVTAKVVV